MPELIIETVAYSAVATELPRCPDENVLAELVQGLLDEPRAAEIELHLDGCNECRRIVSSVGQSSYLARRTRIDKAGGSGAALDAPSTWFMRDGDAAIAIPEPGTILAAKYRVEGLLGRGGMGVVLAATHLTLGKRVALKLMRPDLAVDKDAAQRFVREARAASLLRSEHIVRVIDLDTLTDGTPYIAMEYLEGEDLGALLARRRVVSVHEAATYIVQVCDAIAEAHAAHIVHRDLKPANLFLTQRAGTPCVKVLDFGVSKIIAGGPLTDDVASTDTKSLVGSPHYMAPEQLISARSVDPRTDIWALGCILFELVSGASPFATGDAIAEILASILRDRAPSLRGTHPAGFAEIVERCLDKDPASRFQRVEELAAALVPFTSVHREAPPIVGPPLAYAPCDPAPTPRIDARSSSSVDVPHATRRRWWLALLVLPGIVAGIYLGLRTPDEATPPVGPVVPAPVVAPVTPPVAPSPVALPPLPPSHTAGAEPIAPVAKPQPSPRKRTVPKKTDKLEDDLLAPTYK